MSRDADKKRTKNESPKPQVRWPLLPGKGLNWNESLTHLSPEQGHAFTATRIHIGADTGAITYTQDSVTEITDAAVLSSLTAAIEAEQERKRQIPGRVPLSPDEYAEYAESIVKEWRVWKAKRHTQTMFADNKGWNSRTILNKAIYWYRSKYGANSV